MPSNLRSRFGHPSRPPQQIETADPERNVFAGPQAGIGSDPDQHPIGRLDRVGQRLDWAAVRKCISLRWTLGSLIPSATFRGSRPPSTALARICDKT